MDTVGVRHAIDFNTAPGLRWTGLEAVLSPTEVVSLIEEYVQYWHDFKA